MKRNLFSQFSLLIRRKTGPLLFLLLLLGTVAQAQLINNSIRYDVHFTQGIGIPYADNTQFMIKLSPDTDNQPTNQFVHQPGQIDGAHGGLCYNITNPNRDPVPIGLVQDRYNMYTQWPWTAISASQQYDLEVFSWYDNKMVCSFDAEDRVEGWSTTLRKPTLDPPLVWTPFSGTIHPADPTDNRTSQYFMKHTWRYVDGDAVDRPLDFGDITNTTKTDINSNRGTPAGAQDSFVGYNNIFNSPATTHTSLGRDVLYTFSVNQTSTVTVSTNFPETNFIVDIHLYKYDASATGDSKLTWISTAHSSANKAQLLTTLCSGRYAVIVEGGLNIINGIIKFEEGVFKLSATANTVPLGADNILSSGVSDNVIPFPLENQSALLTGPVGLGAGPLGYSWEQKINEGKWTTIAGANGLVYSLTAVTTTVDSETLTFRRKVTDVCSNTTVSNEIPLTVVKGTGTVSGYVRGPGSPPAGVKNVMVCAQKSTSVPGSPANVKRCTYTDEKGFYSISSIYYGLPTSTALISLSITASKGTDLFDPPYLSFPFQGNILRREYTTNTDFTDLSAIYAVTGTVSQTCMSCEGGTAQNPVKCGVNGVTLTMTGIKSNDIPISVTTLTGLSNPAGTYGLTVDNPGSYTITARASDHQFVPQFRVISTDVNVNSNIDFIDTKVQRISGKFTAGCGDVIGRAKLIFKDVLTDKDGKPITSSCFSKTVVTEANTGLYTIVIPARKYVVSVESFTSNVGSDSPYYVSEDNVKTFFGSTISRDSITRDITATDATLNLTYVRPPVLQVVGLDPVCNGQNSDVFAVVEQLVPRPIQVKVFQGPADRGCKVSDGLSVTVTTSIQTGGNNQTLVYPVVNGAASFTLTPGTPNIEAPYYRTLNINYTDNYKRQAGALKPNVVVTGTKSYTSNGILTASPELPFMVLHDPAGDQSYSKMEEKVTRETAVRFSTESNKGEKGWVEAKLGNTFITGFIGYETEVSVWGSISSSLDVTQRNLNASESILTLTTSQAIGTDEGSSNIDPGGSSDVFMGAALNFQYAPATSIIYKPDSCKVVSNRQLIIRNAGFKTTYLHTQYAIENNVIPTLEDYRDQQTSQPKKDSVQNQIDVWQQLLKNNEENKKQAAFDRNITFSGGSAGFENSVTAGSTTTNSVEFDLEIDRETAGELGFEIGGSGIKGGAIIHMKMDVGQSTTTTNLKESTFTYLLKDNDKDDIFSVSVKKDPVYGSPVFDLLGGQSSCPYEPGTLPLDEMSIRSPTAVATVDNGGTAEFDLILGNISPLKKDRTYLLKLIDNPNNASVSLDDVPINTGSEPGSYSVRYGSANNVSVRAKVKQGTSSIFTYGLRFLLSDACDGGTSQELTLTANFRSPCSSITLVQPLANWISTKQDDNQMPIKFKGYVKANLNTVTLEYRLVGTNVYQTAFTLARSDISSSAEGMIAFWNTTNLPDGTYTIRLKLTCDAGTVYSEAVTGLLDRTPPVLFGKADPTDDNYVPGDLIGATYNDPIGCSYLSNNNLKMTVLGTNTVLPALLNCSGNRLLVTPSVNLNSYVGKIIQVVLTNIPDQYGNAKMTPDTILFTVGAPVVATGPNALSLSITDGARVEGDGKPTIISFNLPQSFTHTVSVNFALSGTAKLGTDFTLTYPASQPTSATVNAIQGVIVIPANTKSVSLSINSVMDSNSEPEETIIISLLKGGDYLLGAVQSVSATIKDGPDLTLLLYARPSIHYGTSNFTVVVDVVELNNVPTSGLITVRLTKDSRTRLSFDNTLMRLNNRDVQNSAWTFSSTDPNYYVMTTTQSIPAGDKLSFGLNGVMTPGSTTGTVSSSAGLVGVSNEYRLTNNADADKIEYFQQ